MEKARIEKHELIINAYCHRALALKNHTTAKWIIGFNGFGRSALDLIDFFKRLDFDLDYNLLAIENPYHGGEQNRDAIFAPLSKNDLKDGLSGFINLLSISRFHLFGFSMGGKIVSNLASFDDVKADNLILMAPEGYEKRAFYIFLSKRIFLLKLSKQAIEKPSLLLAGIRYLSWLKLIRKNLSLFLHKQISNPEKRELIFNTWCSLRHVQDTFSSIQPNNNVMAIYGKYDPVIVAKRLVNVLDKVKLNDLKCFEIDGGHGLNQEKHTDALKMILNKKTLD